MYRDFQPLHRYNRYNPPRQPNTASLYKPFAGLAVRCVPRKEINMRKILCDRCGGEIEEEKDIVRVIVKYHHDESDYYSRMHEKEDRSQELCGTCAERVCGLLDDGGDAKPKSE